MFIHKCPRVYIYRVLAGHQCRGLGAARHGPSQSFAKPLCLFPLRCDFLSTHSHASAPPGPVLYPAISPACSPPLAHQLPKAAQPLSSPGVTLVLSLPKGACGTRNILLGSSCPSSCEMRQRTLKACWECFFLQERRNIIM